MKIQLLLDKTGLVYGTDNKRISCESAGILKIGNTDITVTVEGSILPTLFYGASGMYDASYISNGEEYDLGKVEIRNGRISSPSPTAVEFMRVRHRADVAEMERDKMKADIDELRNIFDTNSLNFIIGGDEK